MKEFLLTPYPFYEDSRQGLKICLGIGLFIGLFCMFFKPFSLERISTAAQLGYGMVSFLVCLFFIVFLPMIFRNELQTRGWTIGKEILWVIGITTSLGVANYFYSGFAFEAGYDFHLKSFMLVLFYTALVAVIPAIAIVLYKQVFVYKKVLSEVSEMDRNLGSRQLIPNHSGKRENISLRSELKGESFKMQPDLILLIASSGNYVEIHYLNDGKLKKGVIRNALSEIERQLTGFDQFVRCHRSYIVNLDRVEHISGNLQGYQLEVNGLDDTVPVSRSYTKTIKAILMDT